MQHFVVGLRTESEHSAFGKKRGSPLIERVSSTEGAELLRKSHPASH